MGDLANFKLIETLLLLLPGFLTAEIIGLLVLREERKLLDRVIQALIFTFLAHLLWTPFSVILPRSPAVTLLGLGVSATIWGVIFVWTINSGAVHGVLRRFRLTQAASHPSVWYGAFYEKQHHVILHLRDGRRIFGWPRLFPFEPDKGHILLESAEWLDRIEKGSTAPLVDFLIDVADVRFVEFLPPKDVES